MVETAPSNEEVDPYRTLESDDDADQFRTVSQEEELCIESEVAQWHFTRSCGATTHAKGNLMVERSSGGSNGATTHVKGISVERSNGCSNGATTHVKRISVERSNGGSNGATTHVKGSRWSVATAAPMGQPPM
jgi:hypothetical protein